MTGLLRIRKHIEGRRGSLLLPIDKGVGLSWRVGDFHASIRGATRSFRQLHVPTCPLWSGGGLDLTGLALTRCVVRVKQFEQTLCMLNSFGREFSS